MRGEGLGTTLRQVRMSVRLGRPLTGRSHRGCRYRPSRQRKPYSHMIRDFRRAHSVMAPYNHSDRSHPTTLVIQTRRMTSAGRNEQGRLA